ncbi:MAG: hypothetical protein MUF49_26675 [Oculatellaceae cyanobacterium Prado106]|jgi:hypothetical protein|nr:hypothetical protein [Oculatellaceae cyanobacterium Prado106]
MSLQKIIQELQEIPTDKLAELYDVIHNFRLSLEAKAPSSPGTVTGNTVPEPCSDQETVELSLVEFFRRSPLAEASEDLDLTRDQSLYVDRCHLQ